MITLNNLVEGKKHRKIYTLKKKKKFYYRKTTQWLKDDLISR